VQYFFYVVFKAFFGLLFHCEAVNLILFYFLINCYHNFNPYFNVPRFRTLLWLVGRLPRTSLVARWRACWALNWPRGLSGLDVLQRSMPSNRWNWKMFCLVSLL
jgi:hypothetical protein